MEIFSRKSALKKTFTAAAQPCGRSRLGNCQPYRYFFVKGDAQNHKMLQTFKIRQNFQ